MQTLIETENALEKLRLEHKQLYRSLIDDSLTDEQKTRIYIRFVEVKMLYYKIKNIVTQENIHSFFKN